MAHRRHHAADLLPDPHRRQVDAGRALCRGLPRPRAVALPRAPLQPHARLPDVPAGRSRVVGHVCHQAAAAGARSVDRPRLLDLVRHGVGDGPAAHRRQRVDRRQRLHVRVDGGLDAAGHDRGRLGRDQQRDDLPGRDGAGGWAARRHDGRPAGHGVQVRAAGAGRPGRQGGHRQAARRRRQGRARVGASLPPEPLPVHRRGAAGARRVVHPAPGGAAAALHGVVRLPGVGRLLPRRAHDRVRGHDGRRDHGQVPDPPQPRRRPPVLLARPLPLGAAAHHVHVAHPGARAAARHGRDRVVLPRPRRAHRQGRGVVWR
mmetsp:Transcript_40707/g.121413  ORF Transcript_40707/g.121413 Transcript_40707/m.121413 type:complete len:317 (-) Transcript_40707:1075-2025(-)